VSDRLLKQVGRPLDSTEVPSRATADPAGGFVYVSNNVSKTVSAFSIDPISGALSEVPGSPFKAGTAPTGVTVDPAGQFVYVANSGSDNVSAYTINATSGALAQIPGSPFKAGVNPIEIAVTRAPAPMPGNVYVADTSNNAVKEILAAGGANWLQDLAALQLPNSVKAISAEFTRPTGIAVDGHGNVYVTEQGGNSVKVITPTSGYHEFKPLGPRFDQPTGIAVDSMGDVYVTESGGKVKEIVATRGNIPASAISITLGPKFDKPSGIAVDADGNVYVADTGHRVVKKIVAVHGSIPPSPNIVTLGGVAAGCVFNCPDSPVGVAVDATGNLYVADAANGEVEEFVSGRGAPVRLVGGLSSLSGIAVDAHGNVYVTDGNAVKEVLAGGHPAVKTLGSNFAGPTGIAVR